MSLFRVGDFWNFDLEQLLSSLNNTDDENQLISINSQSTKPNGEAASNFTFSLGSFECIGPQDVFVCANLTGLICIVQVPPVKQKLYIDSPEQEQPRDESPEPPKNPKEFDNRQLLLAQKLPFPIVDLKCGYFNSTVRQSIAVLTFDKLFIYQIRRRQVDLVSGENSNGTQALLLSHELEEHHKFDLLITSAIALNLVLIDNHASRNSHTKSKDEETMSGGSKPSLPKKNQQHWLQLPQRDNLIVQYSSQFIFSLFENKKLLGHFKIITDSSKDSIEEIVSQQVSRLSRVDSLTQFVGFMPICYIDHADGPSSLIISLSDNQIYSVPMEKLLTEAKHNVMKRVTMNLLQQEQSTTKQSSLSYNQQEQSRFTDSQFIRLNLESSTIWTRELACLPLQMQHFRRLNKLNSSTNQLIIMSRYNLDLFLATNGEHLWSQRFEAPLICMYGYKCEIRKTKDTESNLNQSFEDRALTLVCSDSVGGGRSNLSLFEDEQMVWSAVLNTKPNKILRANLGKMQGVLVTLDSIQLKACYLGTKSASADEDLVEQQQDKDSTQSLGSLLDMDSQIDTPLLDDNASNLNGQYTSRESTLKVDVQLEASNEWPAVIVEARISISSINNNVLRDLSLILEFDDMINFQTAESYLNQSQQLSDGVIQIHLGHIWPDRMEPVKIIGKFSMPTNADITGHQEEQKQYDKNLLPKTLEVKMYFKYNEKRIEIHEQAFMLPLNLVAELSHIDYSSGLGQNLEDILANLAQYKPPYYRCDLFFRRSNMDFMEFVEEFIESELLCRGLNLESANFRQRTEQVSESRKWSTLENISLLAQSLDCRLKFKNITNTAQNMIRQSSEDQTSTAIMVSVAMKLAKGSTSILSSLENRLQNDEEFSETDLLWIHLCDIGAKDSQVPGQLIKQRLQDLHIFKSRQQYTFSDKLEKLASPVMVSIESRNPLIVLFIQDHFRRRTKQTSLRSEFLPLDEPTHDTLQIDHTNDKITNFIGFNKILHKILLNLFMIYKTILVDQSKTLKEELNLECTKLNIVTLSSLSMSKKLCDFPEEVHQQFSYLAMLTKQYQLRFFKVLTDLENLSKLDCEFTKVASSESLFSIYEEECQCDVGRFTSLFE